MRTSKNITISWWKLEKAVILFYDQIKIQLLSSSMDLLLEKSNNLINKVQEKALELITNDYRSSFNILLDKCNGFSIHQRNLQTLMIELYKTIHQIAPPNMKSLFAFRENTHNIRNYQILSNNVRKTVIYGLKTILYRSTFF